MAATAVNVIKEGTALRADAALRLHCTMIWGTDCSCRRKASQFGCTERAEFSLGGLPFNIHTTYWNIKSIQLFFRRRRPTKLTGKEAISTLSEGRREDPLLSLSLSLSSSINRCSLFSSHRSFHHFQDRMSLLERFCVAQLE